MKMLGSFFAGAVAGFLLGSTKQGCAVRDDLNGLVKGLFSADEALDDMQSANVEETSSENFNKSSKPSKSPQSSENQDQGKPSNKQPAAAKDANRPAEDSDSFNDEDKSIAGSAGLTIDKAHELQEKLGAKVAEIQGSESLPHSHISEATTPTSRLSA